MKILFINQTYHPDPAATAQYLTDISVSLVKAGHEVTILTGCRNYVDPSITYPAREIYQGVKILRVEGPACGKQSPLGKVWDAAWMNLALSWNLIQISSYDRIVAMTSPPMIAWLASLIARVKKIQFVYWVMDVNPDEAIEAGWIKLDSFSARILEWMLRDTLVHSAKVIVLDEFMRERLEKKIVQKFPKPSNLLRQTAPDESSPLNRRTSPSGEVLADVLRRTTSNFSAKQRWTDPSSGGQLPTFVTIPPWSHDEDLQAIPHDQNPFRKKHNLENKFVVMYSGNHSICHPLNTLLQAAYELKEQTDIAFVFIGGGERVKDVAEFRANHRLTNILQLPYQDRKEISYSLSAADLHTVVMGDAYIGIVHPCKIYGILKIGRPFVYIGPEPSHISEIIKASGDGYAVHHGEVSKLADRIVTVKNAGRDKNGSLTDKRQSIIRQFESTTLIQKFIRILEDLLITT